MTLSQRANSQHGKNTGVEAEIGISPSSYPPANSQPSVYPPPLFLPPPLPTKAVALYKSNHQGCTGTSNSSKHPSTASASAKTSLHPPAIILSERPSSSYVPALPPPFPLEEKNARTSWIPLVDHSIADQWMERYEDLKRYKETNGDTRVPVNHPEHPKLYNWCLLQKRQETLSGEGKPTKMNERKRNLLNALEFEWTGEKYDKFWNDNYRKLLKFYEEHGTSRVKESYDMSLVKWLHLQRRHYNFFKEGKRSALTAERMKLLDDVELTTKFRNNSTWDGRYEELVQYHATNGHTNVPQKYKANSSLGRWVDCQKTNYKKMLEGRKTHMTVERMQKLIALGFQWRP